MITCQNQRLQLQAEARRGENDKADTFQNPEMLKRFEDILSFSKEKQAHILYAIDSMIKATKLDDL